MEKTEKQDFSSAHFENYDDYIRVQQRCAPKEFLDPRLRIVSSLVYAILHLKRLGIDQPQFETQPGIAGQLLCNHIRILDAGARDGWTVELLHSLGYTQAVGVELLPEYVAYCKARNRSVVQGDLHRLEFADDLFDFVYCRHSIEHCLDPIAVLNELTRVTRPGGAVFCSFPMEEAVFDKHTTAIPNPQAAGVVFSAIGYQVREIFVGPTLKTRMVIPEGNEWILFFQKKPEFGSEPEPVSKAAGTERP